MPDQFEGGAAAQSLKDAVTAGVPRRQVLRWGGGLSAGLPVSGWSARRSRSPGRAPIWSQSPAA